MILGVMKLSFEDVDSLAWCGVSRDELCVLGASKEDPLSKFLGCSLPRNWLVPSLSIWLNDDSYVCR